MRARKIDPVRVAYGGRAELAEGPVWHEGALWWVDIVAGTFNRLDPATGENRVRTTGDFLAAAAPVKEGGWLLARRRELVRFSWPDGAMTPLAAAPAGVRPTHRFNDGKCDVRGRFWVGTLSLSGDRDECALYAFGVGGRFERKLTGVSLSNGMAWSPANDRFYYADTATRRVDQFDFQPDEGTLRNRRPLVVLAGDQGWPDGLTCDAEGCLWIACWGGSGVLRVDGVTGRCRGRVALPASQVTCCTFGGPELRTLYISTAWHGLAPEQRAREPLAGSIFAVETDTEGQAARCFAE